MKYNRFLSLGVTAIAFIAVFVPAGASQASTSSTTVPGLTVTSEALSDISVVHGTDDVLFFRGQLHASQTDDILIDALIVEDENGTEWDDRIDNLTLYINGLFVDIDNTVSLERGVFNGFNYTVLAGTTVEYEIYGDISSGLNPGVVDVKLVEIDAQEVSTNDAVYAVDSVGNDIRTNNLTTERDVTIVATGDLSVEVDTNMVGLRSDRWVLAGEDNVLIGRIQLQAVHEDVALEDLTLTFLPGSGAATLSDFLDTVDNVSVYQDSTLTTMVGSVGVGSNVITFDDLDFVVPQNHTTYLYIGVDLNKFGAGPTDTASEDLQFQFHVEEDGTTAEGVMTNDTIIPSVNERKLSRIVGIAGTRIYLNTDFADGVLVGGNQTLFRFNVTADAGSNATRAGDSLTTFLRQIQIQLATDVGTPTSENVTNLEICRVDSGVCLPLNTVGTLSDTNTVVRLQTQNDNRVATMRKPNSGFNEINSGETVTYAIRGTVTNVQDKFLQVSIIGLNNGGFGWAYDLDNNDRNNVDRIHQDVRADEPVSLNYPALVGGSLAN